MPTFQDPLTTNGMGPLEYYSSTTATPMYASYSAPTMTLTTKFEDVDEKIKEYEEKLDKHVEQLEEDIQFFNEERIKQDEAIKALINAGVEKDKKIKILEDKIIYLEGFTGYLENRIAVLEDKFNEH